MLKAKHLRHPLRTMFLAHCYYSSVFYDLAHGIRTTDTEPLSTLELTRPEHLAYGSSCLPSQPQDIRSVFYNLGLDFCKYCFVDFGCGKGRVLAYAARYPFKSVIGVDFAKEHCEATRSNLERVRSTHRCGNIQVHHVDATEFDLPQDPCVVYIYNSFRGPVLTAVLERIQRSVFHFPRHVRIAYVAPTLPEFFLRVPGIQIFKPKKRYVLYDLGDLT
jgi:SAM-dependent methyltransferase